MTATPPGSLSRVVSGLQVRVDVAEDDLVRVGRKLDALAAAVEHVINDSPGTPESVKEYLRRALRDV